MTNIVTRDLKKSYSSIYDFFKKGFYENAIKEKESILFDNTNVWTESNLKTILSSFDKEELSEMKGKESSKDNDLFWKRLKDQFKNTSDESKQNIYLLLADLIALHYVFTAGSGSQVMQETICNKLPHEVFGVDDVIELDFTPTDSWNSERGNGYFD